MSYANNGFKVTIDNVEWKKTGKNLFKYVGGKLRAKLGFGCEKFILEDQGLPLKRADYFHGYFDHAEVFVNQEGDYAIASHVYDILYSPHHPDRHIDTKERIVKRIEEYAAKHGFNIKVEPVESWYSPKNTTLLWWQGKYEVDVFGKQQSSNTTKKETT